MKNVLWVDCCIRGEESRTLRLSRAFLDALPQDCAVTHLDLMQLQPRYCFGDYLEERQKLLEQGNLSHPRFDLAHQFAAADAIVVSAPFWDLSFPALLKVYIEQVSLDGITFGSTAAGLVGLCRAERMVYLTTRGGFYTGDELEMGSRYMEALCKFFGIDRYDCVAADGMDIAGFDGEGSLKAAMDKAAELAKTF